MKDATKIFELNKWLSDLPEIIKYKDGDEIVDCRLTFYFHKDGEYKWTAAYHCSEYDYHLIYGFGDTLVDAVNYLRKALKEYRKHRGEGYIPQ